MVQERKEQAALTNNPAVIAAATFLDSGTYSVEVRGSNKVSVTSGLARIDVQNPRPGITPVAATGWNSDRVLENTPWFDGEAFDIASLNATVGGYYWFEAGFQGRADGLPGSRLISSSSNSNAVFELQPYDTNNVIALEGTNSVGDELLSRNAIQRFRFWPAQGV